MYPERVKQFKVNSNWVELVNKQIRQIDAVLREVQFLSRNGSTIVRGVIHRDIRYLEKEGLLRKIEDLIQFEIDFEEPLPISFASSVIELRPDFFLWQPGNVKDKKATLEQGFSLIFKKNPPLLEYEVKSILVKSIVAKGNGSMIIKIPLLLPLLKAQPKKFIGKIRFHPAQHPPVIEAEIIGEIEFRTEEGLVKEIDFQQPTSMLLDLPIPTSKQTLQLQGEISGIQWKNPNLDESWTAEGILHYQWFMVEPQTIICKEALKEDNERVHKLKTAILFADEMMEIPKTFCYFFEKPFSDVSFNVADLKYDLQVRKNALLLNVHGFWDVTFADQDGVERYRQYGFNFDELIPYPGLPVDEDISFTADLQMKPTNYSVTEMQLTIVACCFFCFQAYNHRHLNILAEEGELKKLVFAKRFIGNQMFSFHGGTVFNLQCQPLHMESPKAKLAIVKSMVQNGWFRVEGWVEIAIAYIDQVHIFREDLFKANFEEGFIWEVLEPAMKIEISANLEYDSFLQVDQQLNYQYFIKIAAESYREEQMELALAQEKFRKPSAQSELFSDPDRESVTFATFEVDAELPLSHGRIKEIIENRTLITQFQYRGSGGAILITGELSGEIEYWDEDYYLRKEPVKVSFWRFIPGSPDLTLKHCRLVPEVNHIRYVPLKAWPWQRMLLQIHFELGIKCEVDNGENFESVISKPEQFPEFSGRG